MEKQQKKEFEYSGTKLNGFLGLIILIALIALGIYSIVVGANAESNGEWLIGGGIALLVLDFIGMFGFFTLEPNEAIVMIFFGEYRGTFTKHGFYWTNPFMSCKKLTLRARNLDAEPIKVNDKEGNPILIGLVMVWKLKDTYKAMFDIDAQSIVTGANGTVGATASMRMNAFEKYVRIQSDAALREVAGLYAYDDNKDTIDDDNELTLRSGGTEINEQLVAKLNERLEFAGIEVKEARLNYLAYAPEIAAVMLRRQQATAVIAAREKIVEGAVSMVKLALDKLGEENIELDEEKRAAMVSNLLVVLCADESAQPVINTGTLNH
ncbi:MAG: SPFH domain-containing protein [Bacteroidales bacterium]|nr:SPFH domain-containing protein [Bacteroidales bacterium]